MVGISKKYTFESSHILPKHPGKCANLHGHSWRLVVSVFGPVNLDSGFVMDYHDLDIHVQPIVDMLDHKHLNGYVRYPSSENLAIHIAHLLRSKFIGVHYRVAISETAKCWSVWDSRSQYCQDIFTKDILDSVIGAMDAGWRSPDTELPASFESKEAALEYAQTDYQTALDTVNAAAATLHQVELYIQSLGKPGAILEELQPFLNENEKAE